MYLRVILVRMELIRQLVEGRLDLLERSLLLHSQDVVRVSLHRQTKAPLLRQPACPHGEDLEHGLYLIVAG